MATFSIITISYNSSKTIERTIKSVLSQTYDDYEYIIVDGASKDDTLSIIKSYEPLFCGRLKYISERDKGIYDAMNKGIRLSSGKIIGIVNSDDWLEADALAVVFKCYQDEAFGFDAVCCGWMNFHYKNGNVQILKTDKEALISMSRVYEMGGVRHPATFVPKSIYNKYGGFDDSIRIMADTDLILRLVENNVRFIFPNRVVTNMSDGGTSNKNLMAACKDYSQILRKRGVKGLRYYVLYDKWCMKRYIKGFLPVGIVKAYRHVKKS